MAEIFPKCDEKELEQQRTYKPGSLLGRFKGESKGYRPDIFSYNARTIQLTKFSAERSLADTEEGDANEKRFLYSFNSSEAQASTSQRSPLGNFPLLW